MEALLKLHGKTVDSDFKQVRERGGREFNLLPLNVTTACG
jgi:hypothetical protein